MDSALFVPKKYSSQICTGLDIVSDLEVIQRLLEYMLK